MEYEEYSPTIIKINYFQTLNIRNVLLKKIT